MGVPALFRWLSKKYPRIVEHVEEETPKTAPGEDGQEEELPIDISGPNPNGMEFDCLYLDYNGIVHNCTHPEGRPAPETEEDMMAAIFEYTERVISMVRPRKLLMIAIDGVAPRAKMNQQRSRRFRAAQEAKEKEEEKEKALEEWKARGLPVTDEALEQKKPFDSNVITPGTPFQELLTNSLKYWIAKKLNQDPGWKDLQVVLSDASSPGEGEHKIMDHIRRQRSQVDYDPNTTHIMYGLDADLIMLSLATHEPHFKVLREDVFAQDPVGRKCHRCGREGHIAANCIGEAKEKSGEHDEIGEKKPEKKAFIFLDVAVLREYLSIELDVPGLGFPFNLERAIDDWVFLIFLTGNDFLPHAPSLEIREGAIDSLLKIWRGALHKMGGYLTNHGKVELKNVQYIFDGLASQEDEIFRRRKETEERQDANAKRRKIEDEDRQRRDMALEKFQHGEQTYVETRTPLPGRPQAEAPKVDSSAVRKSNLEAAEKLKAELLGLPAKPVKSTTNSLENTIKTDGDIHIKAESTSENIDDTPSVSRGNGSSLDSEIKSESVTEEFHSAPSSSQRGTKRGIDDVEPEEAENGIVKAEDDDIGNESVDPVVETFKQRKVNADGTVDIEDTVMLWEPGYRERYYRQKFGVELSDTEFRRGIVKSYMEGLCWVLEYYYHGCPSWTWYYPYHFAPFAADFTELESLQISFVEGKPFRPYDQLMGVLPAGSRASIPVAFHPLMTDPDSEIIDFYPETFVIDPNGKKMAWQGVALLPFIDEKRLLTAINSKYHKLSEDEVRRNGFGDHFLLVAEENPVYDDLCGLYAKRGGDKEMRVCLNAKHTKGIFGFVRPDPLCVPGSTYYSPLTTIGLNDLINDRSISALYEFPTQRKPHKSILLGGVKLPRPVLTEEERETTRRGGRGGGRGGRGGGRGGYNHHSHNTDYRSAANGHGHPGGSLRMGNGPLASGPGGRGGSYQNGSDQRNGHAQYRGEMNGYNAYGGAPASLNFDPYYQEPQRVSSGNLAYAPPQHIRYGEAPSYPQGAPYQQQQQSFSNNGGYGGYGGGAYAAHAAPTAAPYGGYGGYGAQQNYGNYPSAPTASAPVAASYGGYGGYGTGQPPNPYRQQAPLASNPPRPLGFRSGADANSGNLRGGHGRY